MRLGETTINNQGLKMTIIKYNRNDDIDVEFEDGFICTHKKYSAFKSGMIENKNYPNLNTKSDRIGEQCRNKQGLLMTIIRYKSINDIDVEFEDGHIEYNKQYRSFKSGGILNKNKPTVCGVGIVGSGTVLDKDGDVQKEYKIWRGMLERCYNEKIKDKFTTYKDCKVCDEWLYYPNFKKWYNENYYEVNDEKMELDKDILIKGNKIYSPKTCVIVPHNINTLFIKHDKGRGKYPIGVKLYKNNTYVARCSILGKRKHLGYFKTPEDAFISYKSFKEKYIKQVADEYKDKIPKKLYEAMYKWEVEINE